MKKFLFIAYLTISSFSYAQKPESIELLKSVEGKWSYDSIQKVVTLTNTFEIKDKSKDDIYNSIHNYLSENYIKYGKYVVESKESGKIVTEALFPNIGIKVFSGLDGLNVVNIPHKLTIDIKDGKFRYTCVIIEFREGKQNEIGIIEENFGKNIKINLYFPLSQNSLLKDRDIKVFANSIKYALYFFDKLNEAASKKDNW